MIRAGEINFRETRILSHTAQGDDSTSFVEWSAKLGNTELKAGKPEDVDYVNRKGIAVATVRDNNRVYAYDLIHCQLGEYQRIIRRFRLNDPHGYRLIIDDEPYCKSILDSIETDRVGQSDGDDRSPGDRTLETER